MESEREQKDDGGGDRQTERSTKQEMGPIINASIRKDFEMVIVK